MSDVNSNHKSGPRLSIGLGKAWSYLAFLFLEAVRFLAFLILMLVMAVVALFEWLEASWHGAFKSPGPQDLGDDSNG